MGQTAHLFCKNLGSQECSGRWSHTGRLTNPNKRRDNDFSRHISSVEWGNSGLHQCEISCGETKSRTSYELVVVNGEPLKLFLYINPARLVNVIKICRHLPITYLHITITDD